MSIVSTVNTVNSELDRVMAEMALSAEEREERRKNFNRIAAEDLALIERLTIEYMVLESGNPLTGERIRQSVLRLVEVFSWQSSYLPRGYRVMGGPKTGFYLQMKDGSRASDAQLVADGMSGWLMEIAQMMAKKLEDRRKSMAPSAVSKSPSL